MTPPPYANTSTAAVFKEHRSNPIPLTVVTRAYSHPENKLLTGIDVVLDVQTWAASLAITMSTARVKDQFDIASYTPDRTHWLKPANRAAFEEDNDAEDYLDPDREDYSAQFGPDGTTSLLVPDAGMEMDLHQEIRWRNQLSMPARWTCGKLTISNSTGRARLMSIQVASDAVEPRTGKN